MAFSSANLRVMLEAIATVGYSGRLPWGGLWAASLGFALSLGVFWLTGSETWMIAVVTVLFALTAWIVPSALDGDRIPPHTITLDRVLGIWLATAPLVPVIGLAAQAGPLALAASLVLPPVLYTVILNVPLRRMGQSLKPWMRLGDDLIAAGLVLALSLMAMALAMTALGGAPLP